MHAYQTGNFAAGEFLQRTAQLDEMLAKLASKLNGNEFFNPECGFQVLRQRQARDCITKRGLTWVPVD